MNAAEFSNEFDIEYDNIMSNAAPGLNIYDKSIFLTKAQEQIVTELYELFETSEQAREYLKPLLLYSKLTTPVTYAGSIDINSKCYTIPADVWYIVYEEVKLSNITDTADVKVVSHDAFKNIKRNPFRKNNSKRVLRIDSFNTTPIAELITSDTITYYYFKYIKRPYPIILSSLTSLGITINGQAAPLSGTTVTELPESIHRKIIERAS